MSILEALPTRGNYTLVILLESPSRIAVPSHGRSSLKKGYYAYTGSAVGKGPVSLRQRVDRHLRRKKIKHWHIDHLLAYPRAKVTAVVACASTVNRECRINKVIQSIQGATMPVSGFGSSDCQQNCKSHLVYFGENDIHEAVVHAYKRSSEKAIAIRVA